MKLNLHFLNCKTCYSYTKQNMSLTKLYKGHASSCQSLKHCMTDEDKLALKKEFEKIKL